MTSYWLNEIYIHIWINLHITSSKDFSLIGESEGEAVVGMKRKE
jgi:hypothetical protein